MPATAPPEVTAYVRHWIARARKAGKTWASIADELGVSVAQVANVHDTSRGVGPRLEQTFAEKHHHGSIDELRRVAGDFYRKHFDHARDAHPNRSRALARLKGLLHAEVEERVRSVRYRTEADFPEIHWIEVALEEQHVYERDQLRAEPTELTQDGASRHRTPRPR